MNQIGSKSRLWLNSSTCWHVLNAIIRRGVVSHSFLGKKSRSRSITRLAKPRQAAKSEKNVGGQALVSIWITPKTNKAKTIEARNDLPRPKILAWIIRSLSLKSIRVNISKLFVYTPYIRAVARAQKIPRFLALDWTSSDWTSIEGKWFSAWATISVLTRYRNKSSLRTAQLWSQDGRRWHKPADRKTTYVFQSLSLWSAERTLLEAPAAAEGSSHDSTQTKLILSSRFALLIVILKNIFIATECDSQKHILIP